MDINTNKMDKSMTEIEFRASLSDSDYEDIHEVVREGSSLMCTQGRQDHTDPANISFGGLNMKQFLENVQLNYFTAIATRNC